MWHERRGTAGRPGGRVARWAWLSAALTGLRGVAGMPDYGGHLEHLRQHHPELPVPTEREFYEEYLRTRYAGGPTRCC